MSTAPTTGLPPGPRRLKWLQVIRFTRSREQAVLRWQRKYGDVFMAEMPRTLGTIVFLSRPEHVKQVFAGDPKDFHAGEGNGVLKPLMGDHSVLITDEAEHMRARKLLMPAFNGASLRGYRSLVESIAKNEVDGWTNGETIVSLDRMNELTLEIILQVVFGVTDPTRLDRMRPLITKTIAFPSWMLIGFHDRRLSKLRPWRRYFENKARLDELLYEEIALRRNAPDLEHRTDVLSRLLLVGQDEGETPLSDVELRDQLVTLVLAGHETTASALSWTLHELGRNSEVHRAAVRAADEGDDAYLEACLKEGMRLHPIIDFVARVLKTDQEVAGYRLPAGVTVAPSIYLAHNSSDNFGDESAYRPRRFLDEQIEPNTWIPFGGGVRRCIGAGFSLMEGTVILKEVLSRFTLDAERAAETRQRNITSIPGDKAPLVLSARS